MDIVNKHVILKLFLPYTILKSAKNLPPPGTTASASTARPALSLRNMRVYNSSNSQRVRLRIRHLSAELIKQFELIAITWTMGNVNSAKRAFISVRRHQP